MDKSPYLYSNFQTYAYANKTYRWLGTDNEQFYLENLKDPNKKKLLEDNGWINRQFDYTFNSHGFRCKEFSDLPSIVFLGCSHTMGVGIPQEYTFAEIVARETNLNCVNLGVSGSSIDTAYRMAVHWLPKLNSKFCVLFPTDNSRVELFYLESIPLSLTSWTLNSPNIPKSARDFYKIWSYNENNLIINHQKTIEAIEHVSYRNKTPLHIAEFALLERTNDLGRDLAHHGIKWHELMAQNILSNIKI
jgi:hypothetical protein